MSDLGRFQDAFSAALAGDGAGLAPWIEPGGAAGLDVYRNTTLKGLVDALSANFPTVERLVGKDWLRAAAREFALEHPPEAPALVAYGAAFPAWLAAFPPAGPMPYLAKVAGLDRLWTEAHLAADADHLTTDDFARLDARDFERLTARLHPSARLAWFDDNSASLWLNNRPPAEPPERFTCEDRPEGMLIVRSGGEVCARVIDAGGFAFVSACLDGLSVAEAATRALAREADLDAIIAAALRDGLFVAFEPSRGAPS